MRLPLAFALRYLFARKSYNVINWIAGIGVAGMTLGSMALIVVLSVFNGFNRLVADSLSDAGAPLEIRPAQGKVFLPEGEAFDWALADPRVIRLSSLLEEQVFLSFEGRQSLCRVKGLDAAGEEESPLQRHIVDGAWRLHKGELPQAIAGAALAHSLGTHPRFLTPLEIHYPSRTQSVSLSNPAASLRSRKVQLSGLVSLNAQLDASLLVVPIELLRDLLEYPSEVSAIQIWAAPQDLPQVQAELSRRLGPGCRVMDRYRQDEALFRMMRYEKLAVYLILLFIVLIVAFNCYSSLQMLVIEKQEDSFTLRSLGAPEALLRRIFLAEGLLTTLLGLAAGLLLGVALVLLQQHFSLVPMPGNFAVSAYPVALKATDILWTAVGVTGIGTLMALIPSRKI